MMRNNALYLKKAVSIILIIMFVFTGITVAAAAETQAELEDRLLGTVSADYESNGDPGLISGGTGDIGGVSYGAYQFAVSFDIPHTFAVWCNDAGYKTGKRLLDAYKKDGNTYGKNFNAEWKKIAAENSDAFLKIQREYVKAKYYTPLVNILKNQLNFDVDNYTIALKNAVWSRALQMGTGSVSSKNGAAGAFVVANETLKGGLAKATEPEIIAAVYFECGRLSYSGKNIITEKGASSGVAARIKQFYLEGKYLSHFSNNSCAVQVGVWYRLNIEELNALLKMYCTYAPSDKSTVYANVNADLLNVRTGAGTNYDLVGGFEDSLKVMLAVSKNSSSGEKWYYCYGKNNANETVSGWCNSDYLEIITSTSKNSTASDITNSTISNVSDITNSNISNPTNSNVSNPTISDVSNPTNSDVSGITSNVSTPTDILLIAGDPDSSGTPDAGDALMILQYSVGKIKMNKAQLKVSDVDLNEKIDSADALKILQFSVGKIKAL